MVFKKELMLKRLEDEGLSPLIGPSELSIMDNLDGQPVSASCWGRVVRDDPVYSCRGKDGKVYEVNEADCQ